MSAYSADILATTGLVSYWRLGESSGTSAADSKGTNTGTYTNTPTLGAAGAILADTDTATTFAAASSQYVTAAVTTTAVDNFALECWVKLTSVTSALHVFVTDSDDTGGAAIAMGDGAGGSGLLLTGLVNTIAWVPTNYTFADTNWHHIVFTRDAGTLKMYVDGAAVTITAGAASVPLTPTGNTVIGSGRAGAAGIYYRFSSATLDEVAIYNAAIPAATALDHYTVGITAAAQFLPQFNPIPFMR